VPLNDASCRPRTWHLWKDIHARANERHKRGFRVQASGTLNHKTQTFFRPFPCHTPPYSHTPVTLLGTTRLFRLLIPARISTKKATSTRRVLTPGVCCARAASSRDQKTKRVLRGAQGRSNALRVVRDRGRFHWRGHGGHGREEAGARAPLPATETVPKPARSQCSSPSRFFSFRLFRSVSKSGEFPSHPTSKTRALTRVQTPRRVCSCWMSRR